jgi:hypothetical protein
VRHALIVLIAAAFDVLWVVATRFARWEGGMMKIVTTLVLLCLMATAAHAGERWPANVCAGIAKYEQDDEKIYGGSARNLAIVRTDLLLMLRDHCGIDTTPQMKADVAAIDAHVARRKAAGGGGTSTVRPMNCTTLRLDRDMSTTTCN